MTDIYRKGVTAMPHMPQPHNPPPPPHADPPHGEPEPKRHHREVMDVLHSIEETLRRIEDNINR